MVTVAVARLLSSVRACTLRWVRMELRDDDLTNFERHGAEPLPATNDQGYADHEGARIWYATFGAGHSVIMLHVASATAVIGVIRFLAS